MRNIGDQIWKAAISLSETTMTCPYCLGQLYLTVTYGDGTTSTGQCANCQLGYDPPRGYVTYYETKVKVESSIITGVQMNGDKFNYYLNNSHFASDFKDTFDTLEEAQVRAEELKVLCDKKEAFKYTRKQENNRSWSWNATYHKKCLKKALHDVEYHTKALEYAKEATLVQARRKKLADDKKASK